MKLATITAVYNEEDLLPQYLRHYQEQGVDRIFLLDNGSTDRTLEIAKACPLVACSRFETPTIGFDGPKHHALMAKMMELEVRGNFDFILFVDADEFIVPPPHEGRGGTLRSVIEATQWGHHDLYTTTGYQMVEGPGEAPYDPDVPLTRQRKYGIFERLYSKPVIVSPKVYPVYAMGMHSVSGIPRVRTFVGGFKLLHYSAPSEEIFLKRRLAKESRVHVPRARKTEAYFRAMYSDWKSDPSLSAVI